MKVYIILGHPDKHSFNGKIADAYEQHALALGHEVRRQNLGDLGFDPVLRHGYQRIQELEADLVEAKEHITWCGHLVIIYPMWWGSFPALLKGFFDRVFYPGFAFKYHDNDPFWDKLLKGRSAYVIATSDAPVWWLWWKYRNSDLHTMREAILEFCGFSPVTFRRIGRVKYLDQQQRDRILAKVIADALNEK